MSVVLALLVHGEIEQIFVAVSLIIENELGSCFCFCCISSAVNLCTRILVHIKLIGVLKNMFR